MRRQGVVVGGAVSMSTLPGEESRASLLDWVPIVIECDDDLSWGASMDVDRTNDVNFSTHRCSRAKSGESAYSCRQTFKTLKLAITQTSCKLNQKMDGQR